MQHWRALVRVYVWWITAVLWTGVIQVFSLTDSVLSSLASVIEMWLHSVWPSLFVRICENGQRVKKQVLWMHEMQSLNIVASQLSTVYESNNHAYKPIEIISVWPSPWPDIDESPSLLCLRTSCQTLVTLRRLYERPGGGMEGEC